MSIILQIADNFYVISLQVLTKKKNETLEGYIKIHRPQLYSGIFKNYSGMNNCITLAYSEHWYTQNPDIFKTRGIFRTLIYPKLWHIKNERHIETPGVFGTLGYSESQA